MRADSDRRELMMYRFMPWCPPLLGSRASLLPLVVERGGATQLPENMVNKEFVETGNCIGRPTGWRRVFLDLLCRTTGHLLWRNMNTARTLENHSLEVYGTHCFRCYKFGYVQGDYRPCPK